ncbi:hypothetical protein H5410_057613 [Solanum commersonii]|uniref:Uncharacterized protein n=1 Tax=Solanum commersonii TaxID=4109 RepID=A0A9J5WQJ0_SOLCO|nr:hypothetical protein H5410_057613 [Solanum commersonii]
MSQGASSVVTTQSFANTASSSKIKCSSCLCEGCEQQHEYLISLKEKKSVTTAPVSSSITKGKVKEKEKEKKVVSGDVTKQQYPFEGFNIVAEGPTELIDKDDHYLVNCSKLGFNQLDFIVVFSKKKDFST